MGAPVPPFYVITEKPDKEAMARGAPFSEVYPLTYAWHKEEGRLRAGILLVAGIVSLVLFMLMGILYAT